MPQVLFIHSAGAQNETEGSGPMLAALRKSLEPAIEIIAPLMPDPDDPDDAKWDPATARAIEALQAPYVLLGHSLGGSTILKCLAANDPPPGLLGVVIVAAPWWGKGGWQVPSFALPPGFATRLGRLPSLLLMASRDDDVVPVEHAQIYADAIPGARVKLLDGHGHVFDRGSIEPVADAVRELFA